MFSRFTSIIHHAVDAFSANQPADKSLATHWQGVTHYFLENKEHRVSVDQTSIPADLDGMLAALSTEEAEEEESRQAGGGMDCEEGMGGVSGPCMEHLLRYNILETLYTLARTDCPPGMKQLVLQFFTKLLSRIQQPLLPHVHVHKPVQKMVRLCGEVRAGPSESEEVQFLCTLCAILSAQPHLVSFFVQTPNTTNRKNIQDEKVNGDKVTFPLVDSLLKLVNSVDARVGVKACEGLLLCSRLPLAAEAIISHTLFCEKLASRLALLYSRMSPRMAPADIETANVTWGLDLSATDDGSADKRPLLSFLSWLDYCDQLCQVALPQVASELASAIGNKFLSERLKPALLQTCEVGAVSATSLLTRCLHLLSSSLLLTEFTQFMFGGIEASRSSTDVSHSLGDTLIVRCNDLSDELSVVSLRLFEELFRRPPPGPSLHRLVLGYLLGRGYTSCPPHTLTPPLGAASLDLCDDVRMAHAGDSQRVVSAAVAPSGGSSGGGDADVEKLPSEENGDAMQDSTDWPLNGENAYDIHLVVNSFLSLLPEDMKSSYQSIDTGYDMYLRDAHRQFNDVSGQCRSVGWPQIPITDPACKTDTFHEGAFLKMLFDRLSKMLDQSYELNLHLTSVLSRLALLPHPNLHEYLLDTTLTLKSGCRSLVTVLAKVASEAEARLRSLPNFQVQLLMTRKGLLGFSTNLRVHNGQANSNSGTEHENALSAVIVLEEFCKELAAIVFVKYHGAMQ